MGKAPPAERAGHSRGSECLLRDIILLAPLAKPLPSQEDCVPSQWRGCITQKRIGQIMARASVEWGFKPHRCISVSRDMPRMSQQTGSNHYRYRWGSQHLQPVLQRALEGGLRVTHSTSTHSALTRTSRTDPPDHVGARKHDPTRRWGAREIQHTALVAP